MVNHGMGYYERWFRRGYDHRWGDDTGSLEQIDKYRARSWPTATRASSARRRWTTCQWVVREHHLMHPVQRLYGTARPVEIRYEVDGQFVTASVALVAGDTSRQRIRYDSGLTLWVNWRAEPWQVEGRVLPQWGFLALGPETEVGTTLRDGKWADYAECPEYVFADARTCFHMPYRQSRKDIEPRLRRFQVPGRQPGPGDVRVARERHARPGLPLLRPRRPSAAESRPDDIVFQQDHGLPKPTSQWRKGEVIVDGPYELQIRDRVRQLRPGDRAVPRRAGAAEGAPGRGDRILVARLKLQRAGGKITGITAEKLTAALLPGSACGSRFHRPPEPAGTWIDFGKVATDGSLRIERQPTGWSSFLILATAVPGQARLRQLAPAADPTVQVRVLAAGDQHDLGPAPFSVTDHVCRYNSARPVPAAM